MRSDRGHFDEDALGRARDMTLIRRLLPFVRPYGGLFVVSILMLAVITLMDLAIPYVTRNVIDRHIVPVVSLEAGQADRSLIAVDAEDPRIRQRIAHYPDVFVHTASGVFIPLDRMDRLTPEDRALLRHRDLGGVTRAALLILAVVCGHFILTFIQKLVMEYAGQMIMHDLRMSVFGHIQSLSLSFFNRNPVGRLVTRVTNDIQNMQEMFSSVVVFVFKDLFLIAGIAALLVSMAPRLALTAFTVLPLVVVAAAFFARHAREVFRDLRLKVAQINTRFSETIQGIRVIQLFRHERENHQRFRVLNHENYLAGIRQLHIFAVFMPVIELLGSVSLALIIYDGGRGVLGGSVSLGTLVAFISYMKMFFRPIRDIADKYNVLQNAMSSAERIFQVLDNTELEEPRTGQEGRRLDGIRYVDFENVSFGYGPSRLVLHDISFSLEQGRTLAVVGPTGAGKTSLIHLLVRFYEPDAGRISFNFVEAGAFSLSSIRDRIALVTQDPFLFSGSVRQNILGDRVMPEDRFREILDAAHCASFVSRLPQGADTLLTEGGATLSSGERQLISIARAIARDPDLIILDEATSYIDTESEVKIQAALGNLMQDRTAVIIAHRISTARHADHILVLNRGRVVERGTHGQLMAVKGLYHRLNAIGG
ncbi:ABC transporter ATP-binding protein [Desulfatiferula olefinivorans]